MQPASSAGLPSAHARSRVGEHFPQEPEHGSTVLVPMEVEREPLHPGPRPPSLQAQHKAPMRRRRGDGGAGDDDTRWPTPREVCCRAWTDSLECVEAVTPACVKSRLPAARTGSRRRCCIASCVVVLGLPQMLYIVWYLASLHHSMRGCSTPHTVSVALSERADWLSLPHSGADVAVLPMANVTSASFVRDHVMKSRPFIVRGAAAEWPAFTRWSDEYLATAVGPDHAIRAESSRSGVFAQFMPGFRREKLTFQQFIARYHAPDRPATDNMYYAEGAIPDALLADIVAPDIASVLELVVLQMWLGSGGTESLPHTDGMENLLVQLDGHKTVRMVAPTERAFAYVPCDGEDAPAVIHGRGALIPPGYSPVDFFDPDLQAYPLFEFAHVIEVDLHPGDMLYVPAYTLHHVRNVGERSDRSVAVNWWFATHSLLDAIIGAAEDGDA